VLVALLLPLIVSVSFTAGFGSGASGLPSPAR
jgi:hypothetical protein